MSIYKILALLRERISDTNFPPEKLNGELSNALDDLILELSPKWREISQIVTPLRPLAMEAILREAIRSEERGDDVRAIHGYKQVLIGSLLRLESMLLASSQRVRNDADPSPEANKSSDVIQSTPRNTQEQCGKQCRAGSREART